MIIALAKHRAVVNLSLVGPQRRVRIPHRRKFRRAAFVLVEVDMEPWWDAAEWTSR